MVQFWLIRLLRVLLKTIGRLLDSGAITDSSSLFRLPEKKASWPDSLLMRGTEKRNPYETL